MSTRFGVCIFRESISGIKSVFDVPNGIFKAYCLAIFNVWIGLVIGKLLLEFDNSSNRIVVLLSNHLGWIRVVCLRFAFLLASGHDSDHTCDGQEYERERNFFHGCTVF